MFSLFIKIQTLVFSYQFIRNIYRSIQSYLSNTRHRNLIQPISIPIIHYSPQINTLDMNMNPQPHEVETESDTETDTESEYDLESEYDDIDDVEVEFRETDKINRRYYLGVPFTFRSMGQIVMNCSISVPTFFNTNYSRVMSYLKTIASFYFHSRTRLDILQLHITDEGVYSVIVKTHWIRIVQRRWKTIFKKRNQVIARRASIQNLDYFRMNGRYLYGTNNIPGLRGMLSDI